ncbi:MAG: anti-sigma factor antagonist [Firmicutes bacterium]|nr:anti-sigma factor antagonist [Bacillota bacterium]
MKEVRGEKKDDKLIIALSGRIDSGNAPSVEKEALEIIGDRSLSNLLIDATELSYISSAGLRVLLHLRKMCPEMSIQGVSSEVYEILDMTGFTQMMPVEKAYRVVSIEGCEEIGRGANGTIYRIDKDNVVKVYNNADALSEIQHEREVAKLALILGIPTAISYDVVKVGDSYGSVFELLNARSFSKILTTEPEKMDWCVKEYIKMLKIIHGTLVPEGQLPDMKETAVDWAEFTKDYLNDKAGEKLVELVEAIPKDNHMLHGDYHTKNLELQNDEVLLIDMDTLAVGHPVFEFASIYNAFIGFSELDHEIVKKFQGFDFETAKEFWHKSLVEYFGTDDEAFLKDVENKARIIGYTRLIRRSIRRGGLEDEERRKEIEHWKGELEELLEKTDSLSFDVGGGSAVTEKNLAHELDIEATDDNLQTVMDFIDQKLEALDCPPKIVMEIDLAVEEIFVNIAHYAYAPEIGKAKVRVEVEENPLTVMITFIDQGMPYDPLARQDPDLTLPAEERDIGGLGIFLTKQMMDDVSYEYKDGSNVLKLKKSL